MSDMTTIIRVSNGASGYFKATVQVFDELTGKAKDISAATIQLSLGTDCDPGTWVTATELETTTTKRLVGLPVNGATAVGNYEVWYKITFAGQILVDRVHDPRLAIR